jgi:protein ImuB
MAPDQVVAQEGRQLGFWGGETEGTQRAVRAVARLQGMLGPEAVTVPVLRGGRDPAAQVARLRAGAVDLGDRTTAEPDRLGVPWPGRVPPPSPAIVHVELPRIEVIDTDGRLVQVNGRGELSAPPAAVRVGRGADREVTAWAGPWPYDERWWDSEGHRRRARLQLVLDDGVAHLVALERGEWTVEATYD